MDGAVGGGQPVRDDGQLTDQFHPAGEDVVGGGADPLQRGEAVTGPAAAPASGFTLGMRAALMALRRVFRRFFVPYQTAS